MNNNELLKQYEKECSSIFEKIDDIAFFNQQKVLKAFQDSSVALMHMNLSSGYGYEDLSKPKLCELFARIFKCDKAIVTPHITCGTHALTLCLQGILRPGDTMLSISGMPYDTLEEVILGEGNGSLKDFKIGFDKVEMIGSDFDLKTIKDKILKLNPKMIYIQRSRGYSARDALSIAKIEEVVKAVKEIKKDAIVMVDNCYGEFVEKQEPLEVGVDVMAGSLIKNIGGGIVPTGGYVAGREDLVNLIAGRLTAPSIGLEVGSYNATYAPYFEGVFIAPHVVGGILKGGALLAKVLSDKGCKVFPAFNQMPGDIVRSIEFNDKEKMIKFVQMVQKLSPIDSFAVPIADDMPGYSDKVIMASGSFIQGSTAEMSCDAPIRAPYIAYFQGGITYEHVKILALEMINSLQTL